jgi:hypothetical protein
MALEDIDSITKISNLYTGNFLTAFGSLPAKCKNFYIPLNSIFLGVKLKRLNIIVLLLLVGIFPACAQNNGKNSQIHHKAKEL